MTRHVRAADAHLRRFDHWHGPTLAAAIVVGTCGLVGAVAHQAAHIAPVVKAEDVADLEQPGVTGARRAEPALTAVPVAVPTTEIRVERTQPAELTSKPSTPPAPPRVPATATGRSQEQAAPFTAPSSAQVAPPEPTVTVEPAPEPTAAATPAAPPATQPTATEEQPMPTRRIPPGHAKRSPR